MNKFKNLEVWQEGIDIVCQIYDATRAFPADEAFILVAQMRRASISVPSNIAEGSARNSRKEYVRFLNISLSSLAELETQLIIADKLGLFECHSISESVCRLRQKLINFIKFVRSDQFHLID